MPTASRSGCPKPSFQLDRRRRRSRLLRNRISLMIRPSIRAMQGYTAGEQPRGGEVIKLNTNENPYPPSPRVFEAIRAVLTGDKLRKYPDPLGTDFRRTAGGVLGVDPDAILIGNGSDD